MIDAAAFLIERERLQRFCFQRTKAAIVLRDVTRALTVGETDPTSRLAEWLQFLLTVDAARFADPDDACADTGPSIFAFPTSLDTRGDVATILAASNGTEAIIIDYRVREIALPLFAPDLESCTIGKIRTWDRAMRKRGRICAVITFDATVSDTAVYYDGSGLLRRSSGETFDLKAPFWTESYKEIAAQRCMRRDAWRKNGFQTRGNA